MVVASSKLEGEIAQEVRHRRNFAIISYPEAGKTTLTEKLLLYGGAIQEAGAVKAKWAQRSATSDWMAMEQQRGISITSTVLQFEYQRHVLNLLDTLSHQDWGGNVPAIFPGLRCQAGSLQQQPGRSITHLPGVHRICLQTLGKHGPETPRSHCLPL